MGPIVPLKSGTIPTRRVSIEQTFEGIVIETTADSFFAELFDVTRPNNPIEIAAILLDEVADADRAIVAPVQCSIGAFGLSKTRAAVKKRVSEIRFRRAPSWSKRDIDRARAEEKAVRGHDCDAPMDLPKTDEIELSLFGPGIGECAVVHLGNGEWMTVDSCLAADRSTPVAVEYLISLGVDIATQFKLIVVTHWHDDHIKGAE